MKLSAHDPALVREIRLSHPRCTCDPFVRVLDIRDPSRSQLAHQPGCRRRGPLTRPGTL